MRLIKPKYEILSEQKSLLKGIELAARTCYKSEDKISEDDSSAEKLIKHLVAKKHRAMLEFGSNIIVQVSHGFYEQLLEANPAFLFMTYQNGRYVVSGSIRSWVDFMELNPKLIGNFILSAFLNIGVDLRIFLSGEMVPVEVFKFTQLRMRDLTDEELWIHGFATVKFVVDRGISHEIVRHRYPVSFAQESTRYVNYSKGKFGNEIIYIIPNWLYEVEEGHYEMDGNFLKVNGMPAFYVAEHNFQRFKEWAKALFESERTYLELMKKFKWTPQQARSVLPNALKTEILMKTQIFEWHHFFEQRVNKAAHPQMREVAVPLLKEFKEEFTPLFDNI